MKDFTHELSVKLSKRCFSGENYTEEESLLITYGAELILNNLLKYILLFCMALALQRGRAALIILVIFAVLRAFFGGVHCRTDTGCFLAMLLWMGISLTGAELIPWGNRATAGTIIGSNLAVWEKKNFPGMFVLNVFLFLCLLLNAEQQACICIPVIGECITVLLERRKGK